MNFLVTVAHDSMFACKPRRDPPAGEAAWTAHTLATTSRIDGLDGTLCRGSFEMDLTAWCHRWNETCQINGGGIHVRSQSDIVENCAGNHRLTSTLLHGPRWTLTTRLFSVLGAQQSS